MVRTRRDTSAKKKFAEKPKKVKKKENKGIYKGLEWESFEELAFLYWAYELKNQGCIKSIQRAESYLLSDSLTHDFVVNLKTKSKPATELLLHGHSYTPEFVIQWDKRAIGHIFDTLHSQHKHCCHLIAQPHGTLLGEYFSIIEVKPLWDQNNMERLFKVNQKWMWQKYGIFVNLVKPQDLFQRTFTPKEYLRTPSGKPRKLNWKPKSLFDFLKGG